MVLHKFMLKYYVVFVITCCCDNLSIKCIFIISVCYKCIHLSYITRWPCDYLPIVFVKSSRNFLKLVELNQMATYIHEGLWYFTDILLAWNHLICILYKFEINCKICVTIYLSILCNCDNFHDHNMYNEP